jgi:hypothetical protein
MRYRTLARYGGNIYYEPQGSAVRFGQTFLEQTDVSSRYDPPQMYQTRFDLWTGRVLKYVEPSERLGRFCDTTRGTVPSVDLSTNVRIVRHDMYGDLNRDKPCRDFLVVNDLAARGVR